MVTRLPSSPVTAGSTKTSSSDRSTLRCAIAEGADSDFRHINHALNGPLRGFLRLRAILAPRGPIPVARSTWWAGVRSGRYPAPVKLGPRITAWRIEDIEALIEQPGRASQTACRTCGRGRKHA